MLKVKNCTSFFQEAAKRAFRRKKLTTQSQPRAVIVRDVPICAWKLHKLVAKAPKMNRLFAGNRFAATVAAVAFASPAWYAYSVAVNCESMAQENVVALCTGAAQVVGYKEERDGRYWKLNQRKFCSPFAKISHWVQQQLHVKALTHRMNLLPKGTVSHGPSQKWLQGFAALPDKLILSAAGANDKLVNLLSGENGMMMINESIVRLQMLPCVSSMSLKMVLLQSAWNELSKHITNNNEIGTDGVVAIFAFLLSRAQIHNIESELQFIQHELDVLGNEESSMSERACIATHVTAAMDVLRELNTMATKIQRCYRNNKTNN